MNRAMRREAEQAARRDVRDPTYGHLRVLADPIYAGVGADPIVDEAVWIGAFVSAFDHAEEPAALFGFTWDAVVATWGLAVGLGPKQAWATRWGKAVQEQGAQAACGAMLAELRSYYGGGTVTS